MSTSALASGDHLKLLAPNGGEKWKVGKKGAIAWASIGDPGANVKLELFRNDTFVQAIKGSTANDGSLKWKVPSNLNPGKGYTVEITSVDDAEIGDTSDNPFRVKPSK